MSHETEYIVPTFRDRAKLALALVATQLPLLMAAYWGLPALSAHLDALAPCERWAWLTWVMLAIAAYQPLVLCLLGLPLAVRVLKHQQFPTPGMWLPARTRVQRGRKAVWLAYGVIAVCGLSWLLPVWVGHVQARHEQAACVAASAASPDAGACSILGPEDAVPAAVRQVRLGMSQAELAQLLGPADHSPIDGLDHRSTGGDCPLDDAGRTASCGLVTDFRHYSSDGEAVMTASLRSCWWGAIGE